MTDFWDKIFFENFDSTELEFRSDKTQMDHKFFFNNSQIHKLNKNFQNCEAA